MAVKQPDLYADLTRPEHEAWKRHRNVIGALTQGDSVFRGCVGVALLINSQTSDSWITLGDKRTFVQDSHVGWATMTDVPPGYFQVDNARRRPVSWATVRKTSNEFGVPSLKRGAEGFRAWDFRALKRLRDNDLPVLNAEHEPQLFRCFNAINWAMSSVAFSYNRDLSYAVPAFRSAVSELYDVEPKGDVMLCAGSSIYDGAAYPEQWMPKPYLGFKRDVASQVFDRATTMKRGQKDRYSYSLCDAFLTAMADNLAYRPAFAGSVGQIVRKLYLDGKIPVIEVTLHGDRGEYEVIRMSERGKMLKAHNQRFTAGSAVAEERLDAPLRPDWHDMPVQTRMLESVGRLLGRHVEPVLRLWFERQAVELMDGFVHYPSAIASAAALSSASESALFWEIEDSLDYYRDDCDALVFPPVASDRWFNLSGWLPGDVKYDLTPNHPSFISFADLRTKLRATGPKAPDADERRAKNIAKNEKERLKKAKQLKHK